VSWQKAPAKLNAIMGNSGKDVFKYDVLKRQASITMGLKMDDSTLLSTANKTRQETTDRNTLR
jgi:hypothetical protein